MDNETWLTPGPLNKIKRIECLITKMYQEAYLAIGLVIQSRLLYSAGFNTARESISVASKRLF
jgi:hypothetical protein